MEDLKDKFTIAVLSILWFFPPKVVSGRELSVVGDSAGQESLHLSD